MGVGRSSRPASISTTSISTASMFTGSLSTATVAAAAGYSVQQVRVLEAAGVLPPVSRSSNGYRQFTVVHLHALAAYRDLAYAVGPVVARQAMRDIHYLPSSEAPAVIGRLHVELNRERERALAARAALASIRAESITEDVPVPGDAMTISELSDALGVRPSALRFWESQGLVAPDRIATRAGTARRYQLPAIRAARITAALRAGGYRIPDIQQAIAAVREHADVSASLAALDEQLRVIGHRTLALLRVGGWVVERVSDSISGEPTAPHRNVDPAGPLGRTARP